MKLLIMLKAFAVLLLCLLECIFGQKESSFAILQVKSSIQTEIQDFCVNYQEYHLKELPAHPFTLVWWDEQFGNTAVCRSSTTGHKFSENELIPIQYRTQKDGLKDSCKNLDKVVENPIKFQSNIVRESGPAAILYLIERGENNSDGTKNYLHSQFCNDDADPGNNGTVFYIYKETFDKFIVPKMRGRNDLEFHLNKPTSRFDFGFLLLSILLVSAVLAGSFWVAKASNERLIRKDSVRQEAGAAQEADESTKSKFGHIMSKLGWAIVVFFGVFTFVFLIARFYALVCDIIWTLIGIFCISKCLFAIFKYIIFPGQHGDQRVLFSIKKHRLTPLGIVCYGIAIIVGLSWFFLRYHRNAFVLMDIMNFAIAVYGIKYFAYEPLKDKRNLKEKVFWCAFVAIFGTLSCVWDIFFSSPRRTCGTISPADDDSMRTIGSLVVPMLNDPLAVCWDTGIELDYRFLSVTILAVIISAYCLPFWFLIDFVNEHKFFPYGFVAFFGYVVGLLFYMVLFGLQRMGGQWQLPFFMLFPWPVFAGIIFSLIKGTFRELWNGDMKFV